MTTTEPSYMRTARLKRKAAYRAALDAADNLQDHFRTLYTRVMPFANFPLDTMLEMHEASLDAIERQVEDLYQAECRAGDEVDT